MTADPVPWPVGLPPPVEVGKARTLICLSADMLTDRKSVAGLIHDLYWFSDDLYYIFFEAERGIGSALLDDLKQLGVSIELTQRCFYPFPNPGYKNHFVQITPDMVEHSWQREAVQKTEHVRLTLALAPWKRKEMDLSYAAEAGASRSNRRLRQMVDISALDSVLDIAFELDLTSAGNSIREALERGEPEEVLDRLHTLFTAYLRSLCEKHSLPANRSIPLHSLLGAYVKKKREAGDIRSEMADRILRTSISLLDAFSDVRNDHSRAHHNFILGFDESLLIANSVINTLRFVRSIESAISSTADLP